MGFHFWGLGHNSIQSGAFAYKIRGVGLWCGMQKSDQALASITCVALIPFLRGTLIICPISQGRWWWSFPNNLLLNFPADWPSSSTAYMLSQGDSTPGPTLERLSHQYYSAKQPLKENSFRWPSGDSNRGPSVPQSDSLPLDYRLASNY